MVATAQEQLDVLAQKVIDTNIGAGLKAQPIAIQLVKGDGNPHADIVFIGEAPGKKENIEGKPFIGAAGKFLNVMLASINLDREDVYITNIVKYRPPENRDPTPAEKAEFLPILEEELAIIKPKIIITLGRHSMESFLPGVKIGDIHGQHQTVIFGGRDVIIMPLYHPSAAQYNGSLRQTLLDDFLRVPDVLKLAA